MDGLIIPRADLERIEAERREMVGMLKAVLNSGSYVPFGLGCEILALIAKAEGR